MDAFFLKPNELRKQILDHLSEVKEMISPLLKYIIKGSFLRDANEEVYKGRVAYTEALRRFIYNPAIFNEILMNDQLKAEFFRTFGYQGNLEFTIYPNAWLRDLALANYNIGRGAYLADGILLGTNQVSPCQTKIKVGPITIGDETIFDQHCKIGLNTKIGERCIIGISCHIGLINKIGDNVKIAPLTNIGHFVKIGDNVMIGAACTIGDGCILEEGVVLDDYTKLLPRTIITKQGKRERAMF